MNSCCANLGGASMDRKSMVKVFRALGPEVVEKQFVANGDPVPDGWHFDKSAALAAFSVVAENEVKSVRKPGRPRKEQ